MRIGVQMDPIERMQIEGDTSFAFMLEAQGRGAEVWWFSPEDLWYERGALKTLARQVKVADAQGAHYLELGREVLDIGHFDVVLIRQDPPFDIAYVANTYLLELAGQETLVLNRPSGIRNISEKLATLAFEDLLAPTFVGRNLEAIQAFAAQYQEVVVKRSFLNGGEGVVRLASGAPDFAARVAALLADAGKEPLVVQEFLARVTEAGDKRVMLLDGEIVGALRRMPKAGEFRANIHVGGRAEKTELTAREREVAERVAPLLKDQGILFAGLDLIDERLTEINVTSPTLVRELQRLTEIDVAALFWDKVEAMLAARAGG